MSETVRRVTAFLPKKLLASAMRITGEGLTPTLVEGLLEIANRPQRQNQVSKIRLESVFWKTRR